MDEKRLGGIVKPLVEWYRKTGRELPWRMGRNPYRIWISEIMLQQTRIEAVIPYYERFLKELPDIDALADVEEDRLLKLWEGLGYYSRARNLKKAAMVLKEQYGSRMPADYDALKALPGIGPYTAGAIASIAFDIPVPAVDGNVLRVLSRICADPSDIMQGPVRKEAAAILTRLMPEGEAGLFNEALMELGELICIPNGRPACERCPVRAECLACSQGNPEDYPYRAPKKERRKEKRTIFLLLDHDLVAIRKRPDKGLLAGLYEFPGTEGALSEAEVRGYLEGRLPGTRILTVTPIGEAKHIFSHVEWEMTGYAVRLEETGENTGYAVRLEETGESAGEGPGGKSGEKSDEKAQGMPGAGQLVFVREEELDEIYALPGAFLAFRKKCKKLLDRS